MSSKQQFGCPVSIFVGTTLGAHVGCPCWVLQVLSYLSSHCSHWEFVKSKEHATHAGSCIMSRTLPSRHLAAASTHVFYNSSSTMCSNPCCCTAKNSYVRLLFRAIRPSRTSVGRTRAWWCCLIPRYRRIKVLKVGPHLVPLWGAKKNTWN